MQIIFIANFLVSPKIILLINSKISLFLVLLITNYLIFKFKSNLFTTLTPLLLMQIFIKTGFMLKFVSFNFNLNLFYIFD